MDRQARNELVLENLPLVGYLARDLCAKATHLSREDLVSVGTIALITAADSFDASLSVPFGSYARRRILGAFADDMRANDWATRGARKKITETKTVQDALTATLGRAPTHQELSQALGVDEAEVRAVLNDAARTVVAIDEAMSDYLSSGDATPEENVLATEHEKIIRNAVAALPEKLRTIIDRIYFKGATVKDLAIEMGVTHSAVSQQRGIAIKLLHEALQSDFPTETPAVNLGKLTSAAARRRETYLRNYERLAGRVLVPENSAGSHSGPAVQNSPVAQR
ncbi:sigma-70 family RNA polymerase sigma factor [Glutamicibacter creatinolyticus]|uniref:sigma-70 family RNA polymerase sigma factor n=1 Tax=Glutamicibacter creatinolyticus TaxID=162496 RepID=UPI00321794C7